MNKKIKFLREQIVKSAMARYINDPAGLVEFLVGLASSSDEDVEKRFNENSKRSQTKKATFN